MIKTISEYLRTYVTVSLEGESRNRLISMAVKEGLRFWSYKFKDGKVIISMSVSDYKKLKKYKQKTGVRIKILKKRGLRFTFSKVKKRPGLIVGLFFSIILYLFLSSCYWVIDVNENTDYSKEEILNCAYQNGLYEGVLKGEIDEALLATKIMNDLEDLKWVSINTMGSTVEIAVKESAETPINYIDNEVSNITAEKTGVIKSIEAKQGTVLVKIGEAVSQGQVLVTGVWDSNFGKNEWQIEEEPTQFATASRAVIMAETYDTLSACIKKESLDYIALDSYNRFNIGFFGIEIPFVFSLVPNGEYTYDTNKENLYILGTKMPIYFETENLTRLSVSNVAISEASAKEELANYLNLLAIKELDDGESLVSFSELTFWEDENYYYGKISYIFMENIALNQNIMIN